MSIGKLLKPYSSTAGYFKSDYQDNFSVSKFGTLNYLSNHPYFTSQTSWTLFFFKLKKAEYIGRIRGGHLSKYRALRCLTCTITAFEHTTTDITRCRLFLHVLLFLYQMACYILFIPHPNVFKLCKRRNDFSFI